MDNSQSAGIATDYGLDGRGSIRGRDKSFFILHNVQTGSGTYPVDTGDSSSGVKQPRREADNSPPSSAEVKNGGPVPPFTQLSSWFDV
jgi:hypothetical protein